MSDTSIRISKEARDTAIRLSGEAVSARVLVEDLIEKFANGELVVASAKPVTEQKSDPEKKRWLELRSDIARTNTMIKVIGAGLFDDDEALTNTLNLLTNEFGNCPSCDTKMTCPSCGCFVSDHLMPEHEEEGKTDI